MDVPRENKFGCRILCAPGILMDVYATLLLEDVDMKFHIYFQRFITPNALAMKLDKMFLMREKTFNSWLLYPLRTTRKLYDLFYANMLSIIIHPIKYRNVRLFSIMKVSPMQILTLTLFQFLNNLLDIWNCIHVFNPSGWNSFSKKTFSFLYCFNSLIIDFSATYCQLKCCSNLRHWNSWADTTKHKLMSFATKINKFSVMFIINNEIQLWITIRGLYNSQSLKHKNNFSCQMISISVGVRLFIF